ncbi:MAG: rRNA maturation RNase YbeY [Proteobacteria bacterium]|nr:rRNA maturation RNase YbeY [Pseudomonadota bacterium]
MTALTLELDVDPVWPAATSWEALAARAAEAVSAVAPELAHECLLVSLVMTDDEEVHALNKQWRGKDKPTNVLSFPMLERGDLLALAAGGPPEMLGDIALAHETCAREAADKGVPLEDHAAHLIIHGLLHLAGHDHELGEAEAEAMEALEIKALAMLGIADPYGDHEHQGAIDEQ